MKQKQYYNELNVLSGIAVLCVLAIHGCGSALNMFYSGRASYAAADVWLRAMSNLVAPAVPIFLFVSGYKYSANDVQTPYSTFLKKRLPRVLMSFAIINTLFWILDSIKYMDSFDAILLAKTYIHSWTGYSVAYQLWYIPMYCFVIMLCPLARRVIPVTVVRFCIFAVIGVVQRVLEVHIPVLATYPICFISYPVFFEMGALVHERNWRTVLSADKCVLTGGTYALIIVLLSWISPKISADGVTKYVVYYFAGTIAAYMLSIALMNSRLLCLLGKQSYPLFLLHEPLVGRCVSTMLGRIALPYPIMIAFIWVLLTLLITVLLIKILKKIKWNKILWGFSLQ